MTVANWANWCMIIETFGAFVVAPVAGFIWKHHRQVIRDRETIRHLEKRLERVEGVQDLHRPSNW